MQIQVAEFTPYGPPIVIALVDSKHTTGVEGRAMLDRVSRFFPTQAIMLVSVEGNGFRAYATFQTAELLALLQLEEIHFTHLDLSAQPTPQPAELPF